MAKNKSVFGIYSSRSGVENAVTTLKDSGFQHSDVSVLLPENLGSREIPRHPKALQQAQAREQSLAVRSAGSSVSARWQFRDWAPSSQRDRLWRRWPELELAALLAE